MTNCSIFRVGAWLSNFYHGFSNPLGTICSKMKFETKTVLRIGEEGERKNGGRVKI